MKSSTIRIIFAVALTLSVGAIAGPAVAQDGQSLFGQRTASVTYGPYARFELGGALPSPDDGYWLPPGYVDGVTGDPRVNFDLDGDSRGFGAIALGYDWMNGFRGDLSLTFTGSTSITGPCSGASDGTPCSGHANIIGGSVKTTALMGNVFYSPLEQRGSNSVFQPFIVGGIGLAHNKVGPWTRENTSGGPAPVRSFEGDSKTDLAWSLGFGASLQVTRPGKWPVIVEASWRYYDFGEASGGATPITAGGVPVQPLTFNQRDQVVSIGVRIPLRRY